MRKYLENYDEKICRNITKHPKSSFGAGKLFAERVEARGFTSKVAAGYIKHALEQEGNTQPNSYKPLVQCFSKWTVEPSGGAERLLGSGHAARGRWGRGRYGVLESETKIQPQVKTTIPYS